MRYSQQLTHKGDFARYAMGLFAKLRGLASPPKERAPSAPGDAESPGVKEALRLIEEGNTLEDQGDFGAALSRYTEALVRQPEFPRALLNQGNVHLKTGDVPAALLAYRRVLAANPRHVGAQFNVGNAYRRLGQLDNARDAYESLLLQEPDFTDAYVALGCTLEDMGFLTDAIDRFERALALRPNYAEVERNIGRALHALGSIDGARAHFREALRIDPGYLDAHHDLVFVGQFDPTLDHALALAEAKAFGAIVKDRATPYQAWPQGLDPIRQLKIGLVSGDLRVHPVGFFIEGILEHLKHRAPDSFQVSAYLTYPCTDDISERIKSSCAAWVQVERLTDRELAKRIHDDHIDILIDLAGHTAHNRLAMFAWRPSPLQISWLGYFATTGVDAIDYLIADPSLPQHEDQYFTEAIWRLPTTRLCFTPPDEPVFVNVLPALSGTGVTFGCFNNLLKLNDKVIAAWCQILLAIPQSRLMLKSPQFALSEVKTRMEARFQAFGVSPGQLLLHRESTRRKYFEAYHDIDIALDPFPYCGGTTTVEALWMGVPVVTLKGDTLLACQGAGLLACADLSDWIASDAKAYVALAIVKASRPDLLAALRENLRQQVLASPLFDGASFAGDLATALHAMWKRRSDLVGL